MTITGYPTTNQEIQTMSDAEVEKAFAENFAAPVPRYKYAIDAIRTAIDDLDGAAKDLDEAAKAIEGTTHGYQLLTAAAEVREEITFLTRLQDRIRRMTV